MKIAAGSLRIQQYQAKQDKFYIKNGISREIPFFVFLMSRQTSRGEPLPTPVELDLERQIKPYTALKTLADFLIACEFLICLSPYLFARNLQSNLLTHNRRADFNRERCRHIKIFQAFICWKTPSIMCYRRVQLGLAVVSRLGAEIFGFLP